MLESSSSDEEETNHPIYPTRGGNSTKIFLTAGQSTESEKKSSMGTISYIKLQVKKIL